MDSELTIKQKHLYNHLRGLGRVAVAFSGGVDSTCLLAAAQQALAQEPAPDTTNGKEKEDGYPPQPRVFALTARAAAVPEREIAETEAFCAQRGIEQVVVDVDQLAVPGFAENPPERCYLCKKALFTKMLAEAKARGFDTVVEGSNVDDLSDYRPGMRALAELGIGSPLKEAGLTKAEIRAMSRDMGLPTADKPALACLATRIPTGERITEEKLRMIERAEQVLSGRGFRQVRVRTLERPSPQEQRAAEAAGSAGYLARIEVGSDEIGRLCDPGLTARIEQALREIGYAEIIFDPDGYRRGSMNHPRI